MTDACRDVNSNMEAPRAPSKEPPAQAAAAEQPPPTLTLTAPNGDVPRKKKNRFTISSLATSCALPPMPPTFTSIDSNSSSRSLHLKCLLTIVGII